MPEAQQETTPRPSKMDEVLNKLAEAALYLRESDNSDGVDAALQNAARTKALANVVLKLVECVAGGLGATGVVVSQLSGRVGALEASVTEVRDFISNSAGGSAGGSEAEQVAGAQPDGPPPPPPPPPQAEEASAPVRPIRRAPHKAPEAPVQDPASAAPAPAAAAVPPGMPPEVAQLAASVPVAPIASIGK